MGCVIPKLVIEKKIVFCKIFLLGFGLCFFGLRFQLESPNATSSILCNSSSLIVCMRFATANVME